MLPASTGILTQLQRQVLAAAFARADHAKSFRVVGRRHAARVLRRRAKE